MSRSHECDENIRNLWNFVFFYCVFVSFVSFLCFIFLWTLFVYHFGYLFLSIYLCFSVSFICNSPFDLWFLKIGKHRRILIQKIVYSIFFFVLFIYDKLCTNKKYAKLIGIFLWFSLWIELLPLLLSSIVCWRRSLFILSVLRKVFFFFIFQIQSILHIFSYQVFICFPSVSFSFLFRKFCEKNFWFVQIKQNEVNILKKNKKN